jgi:hypothetical protein
VLKVLQILHVAADDECTQTVHRGEVKVPRLRAYQGSAVSLYEVNTPVGVEKVGAAFGRLGFEPCI